MLLDIEGVGYSARLKFLLHMNRTLFIQEGRPFWTWAERGLIPWIHYIPVSRNF